MPTLKACDGKIVVVGLNSVPAARDRWVLSIVILARRAPTPSAVQMPTDPVRRAPVTAVREHVLSLLHKVVVRVIDVRSGTRRVAHQEMLCRVVYGLGQGSIRLDRMP